MTETYLICCPELGVYYAGPDKGWTTSPLDAHRFADRATAQSVMEELTVKDTQGYLNALEIHPVEL